MFPFNQSYRPRPPSPDPPISPISLTKSGKKTRRNVRHSPYARPALPTPSSPSEVEFDFGTHHHAVYSPPTFTKAQSPNGIIARDMEYHSTSEYVMRIIRESPFEGEKYGGAKEEAEEDCFPPSMFSLSPEPHMHEPHEHKPVTLRLSDKMVTEKQETSVETAPVDIPQHDQEDSFGEDSMEDAPSSQPLQEPEISKETEVFENLSEELFEKPSAELPPVNEEKEETVRPRKAVAYGDLVVVEYVEKKKSYKWPAIVVPPGHMTDNMLDFPPEDDETAVGVRWIEPQPSYSWVPEATVDPLTPEMIDEFNRTVNAPKKLVLAWQMARNPPSVFEYMLEKKKPYARLVKAYKSL